MEEKKINTRIVFSVVAVLLLIAVVAGATYAYFSATASSTAQTVTTATLTMGFSEGELIRATNITPIADSEIKTKAVELPFSVTNTGGEHMNITIKLTDITISDDLKDIDFRWGLYNGDTDVGISFGIFKEIGTNTELTLLKDTILDAGEAARNYKLRVWIHDDKADQNYMQGESFSAKVTVNGEAIEYTPESCFTFSDGKITAYDASCGGTDVVIPKTIGGETVTEISYTENPDINELFDYNMDPFCRNGVTSLIIPNTVTKVLSISDMYSCNFQLVIPESVTYFRGVYMPYNIPESITYFENNGGTGILASAPETVVIPGSLTQSRVAIVTSSNTKNIVLMDGIDWICDLTGTMEELEIPSSVNNICPMMLTDYTYLEKVVVLGKSSIDEFTNSSGLDPEAGGSNFPSTIPIEFRP